MLGWACLTQSENCADTGLTLYQWNGTKSNPFERNKAAALLEAIVSERDGKPQIVHLGKKERHL